MRVTVVALIMGFLLDLLLGDPGFLYHPVRIIGNGISAAEKFLRRIFPVTPKGERIAGIFLIFIISIGSVGIPAFLLLCFYRVHPVARVALEIFFCYQLLATKSLKQESMKVYEQLKAKDLSKARHAVSMIVGRDTDSLDEEGIIKATVETIAENTSDGVTAPLFYMALGGAPLLFLYKAINTMDSMVGYKNDRYLDFGRYPAKLDDIANCIPARISAWLIIISSSFCGFDSKSAKTVYLRDRFCHASPNSAQTEAAVAGALHVQLAGDAWYFGTMHKKPFIGDKDRPIEPDDIKRANRLLYASSAFGVALFVGVRVLVQLAIGL